MVNFKGLLPVGLNFIISSFLLELVLSAESKYEACKPKNCGTGPSISYPFYIYGNGTDYCGHPGFGIHCEEGRPIYRTSGAHYIIKNINYEYQSFRLVDVEVINTTCPTPPKNYSFDRSSIDFVPSHADIVFLYDCNESFTANYTNSRITCGSAATNKAFVALVPRDEELNWTRTSCKSIVAAPIQLEQGEINQTIRNLDYKKLLMDGFTLKWVGLGYHCAECKSSGGQCGFEEENSVCYCIDGSHPIRCNDKDSAAWFLLTWCFKPQQSTPKPEIEDNRHGQKSNDMEVGSGNTKLGLKLGLGLGIGCAGILILLLPFFILWYRRKRREASTNLRSINSASGPSSKSDLEGGSVYFGVRLFSYRELEEATNNFDSERELGDGGFGTVYYGKLRDGREVAVKRLYEHNYRRVKQFMNEIEILTRLRHKNLVSLYGCTSRHSRELLLVYEYIPNGTVADHLHSNGTVADHLHGDRAKPDLLTWPTRLSIAIETASALAYLHASDIIHRDVKTNNILLDNNFCVKVADFGLSRLFPNDVTHVSTAPQGTPGYVDPEYHQCYQLTDKSDVYSFGVVLIELISSLPAVDITRQRDEINLANLAINKIKKCAFDELIDLCLGYKSDEEVKRMTTLVAALAFRCLQQDKEMRPSMDEVLKELKWIESGEYKENQEELYDDNKALKNILSPASPLNCDEHALLKNIRMPPSPDSVTNKWVSSCSTTLNASG